MFDPISQGLAAVSVRSPYAVPLAFVAGAVSSIGPCVAPRFIAIAGLVSGKSRARASALMICFICGLVATYAVFGAFSGVIARAAQLSNVTYTVVALALAAGGVVTLWRGDDTCAHEHMQRQDSSLGGALLLGASFALVVSPCCTPLVLGIIAYTSAAGSAAYGSALLACFALGHALPIIGIAFGTSGATGVLRRYGIRQAASLISGTLMLALCAYYAVLA